MWELFISSDNAVYKHVFSSIAMISGVVSLFDETAFDIIRIRTLTNGLNIIL